MMLLSVAAFGLAGLFTGALFVASALLLPIPDIPQTATVPVSPTLPPSATIAPIPESHILDNGGYHIFQTFNNCGPAALSMALSFYGIGTSQAELGAILRPYQNPQGINDDKSVTLSEVAAHAKSYGFIPYHRPAGKPEIIRRFIAEGLPVITRTWTKPGEDIGHFRVIKGYDHSANEFVQDDSLQGKNLRYTYEAFDQLWQAFNYEFLVLVPPGKNAIARQILGDLTDETHAWTTAVSDAQTAILREPENIWAWINLSVAHFHTGDYSGAIEAYEHVEARLPFRTLWYQTEPIRAYYETGQYDRVMNITDRILENGNRAYSELYRIRGDIFTKQGNKNAAAREFELADRYRAPRL